MPKLLPVRHLGVAMILAGLAVAAHPTASIAATASGNREVSMGDNDIIMNYDYNSDGSREYNNVDWAVSVVFTGNATVNKVKSFYSSYLPSSGSTKYGWLRDDSNTWDTDGGIKTSLCSTNDRYTDHMRVYADGDDRMYSLQYGYYVYATTHLDHAECGTTNKWFGDSEAVASRVSNYASSKGLRVGLDDIPMYNNEPYRVEGNHRWSNNGYATRIFIN